MMLQLRCMPHSPTDVRWHNRGAKSLVGNNAHRRDDRLWSDNRYIAWQHVGRSGSTWLPATEDIRKRPRHPLSRLERLPAANVANGIHRNCLQRRTAHTHNPAWQGGTLWQTRCSTCSNQQREILGESSAQKNE